MFTPATALTREQAQNPMTSPELGRPKWDGFLRALMETLEAHMQPEEQAVLLRAIGGQMAALAPIAPEGTLGALEARINERLADQRWGVVSIALDSHGPALVLTHEALPVLPTTTDAEGRWLGPVLEGLHGGWIGAQPGAEPDVSAQIVRHGAASAVLRYGA